MTAALVLIPLRPVSNRAGRTGRLRCLIGRRHRVQGRALAPAALAVAVEDLGECKDQRCEQARFDLDFIGVQSVPLGRRADADQMVPAPHHRTVFAALNFPCCRVDAFKGNCVLAEGDDPEEVQATLEVRALRPALGFAAWRQWAEAHHRPGDLAQERDRL